MKLCFPILKSSSIKLVPRASSFACDRSKGKRPGYEVDTPICSFIHYNSFFYNDHIIWHSPWIVVHKTVNIITVIITVMFFSGLSRRSKKQGHKPAMKHCPDSASYICGNTTRLFSFAREKIGKPIVVDLKRIYFRCFNWLASTNK